MHVHSPLVESQPLSALAGRSVLLKLDNIQPSGSFKIRGHGHLCSKAAARGVTRFVSSSGGNAGAAVAYAGRELGVPVTIVVPSSTPEFMIQRLRDVGADVEVFGAVWDEANKHSIEIVNQLPLGSAIHINPFDDPDLWDGHASLVTELEHDLNGKRPAAIVVSVGGGGLFLGVAKGMQSVGWGEVPIICAETDGAASFAAMVNAGGKVVTIDGITSIAKSLGALAVSEKCAEWVRGGRAIISEVVTDREAVEACSALAVHHRYIVEPACGAAIAAVCSASKSDSVQALGPGPIVVVVCGGNMASPELLTSWMKSVGATPATL